MISRIVINICLIIIIICHNSECKNKMLKTLRTCHNNIDIEKVKEMRSRQKYKVSPEELAQINKNLTKKILYYTPFDDHEDLPLGFGHYPFVEKGCPVANCFVTADSKLMSEHEYDAIIFFIEHLMGGLISPPNQNHRKPSQHYVMFLMEGPLNEWFPFEKYKNFFNWTMTYRRDSDFYTPYGWIAPKDWEWHYPPVEPINWLQYMTPGLANVVPKLKSKTHQKAAWLVSNCDAHSERLQFVKELQEHFPVDIYGKCGTKKCPPNGNCYEYLANNYMFYLSFENSICQDYVTEKFFIPMNHDILPIVLGGANYSQIAPPKSYINAKDFSSPKELATFLKFLLRNHIFYQEYFQWKSFFKVYNTYEEYMGKAMCHLCEKLNHSNEQKHYENINGWWRKDVCVSKQKHFL